jgi:hypothetical protein
VPDVLFLVVLRAAVDCKGICNAPASDTVFRLRLPSAKDAMLGKWPRYWQFANAKDQFERMPIP